MKAARRETVRSSTPSTVIDASAAVETLIKSPEGDAVQAAIAGRALYASDLIALECANALRGMERGGQITAEEATLAASRLGRLPIRRVSSGELLERVWALRHNLTAYDASYVALAHKLECPLITLDHSLLAARAAGIDVLVPA